MRTEKEERIHRFLEDVDEQIRFKPVHAAVNEELQGHIEDKAERYMEYGLEEEEAYERAIRDMGDASAIGIEMNRTHQLRIRKPLLALILVLTGLGLLGNAVYGWNVEEPFWYVHLITDSGYFLWGLLLLAFVIWKGYPLLLRYTRWLEWGYWLAFLGLLLYRAAARLVDLYPSGGVLYLLFSPSVSFGLLQLAIPFSAVLLYRRRHQGMKGLLPVWLLQGILILFSRFVFSAEKDYVPILTMLASVFLLLLYMMGKGYFTMERRKGMLAACTGFLLLLALWCAPQRERLAQNVQAFANPASQVTDAWDDAYNNVLIQELLGRARLAGEIELTQEERISYYTSVWYFTEGEGSWKSDAAPGEPGSLEAYRAYRMQQQEEIGLGELLPQHWHNNYRMAWWILRYGWLPGLLLMLLPFGACVLMFDTSFRIRNRLGRVMALGCSLAFAIQLLFYTLGNFGFQFGKFGNLPFLSEGYVSITGSAVMAGLLLSAYRFDAVVAKEP